MKKIDPDTAELLRLARDARKMATAPYSHFKVGAVVRTASGKIYTGCNVENATFSLTICAERLAIFKALSEGDMDFTHVVITADSNGVCYPCGACRQIISEYAPRAVVVCANLNGTVEIFQAGELLPHAFDGSDVKRHE
jgi:homotetrameric cytidine deaminase